MFRPLICDVIALICRRFYSLRFSQLIIIDLNRGNGHSNQCVSTVVAVSDEIANVRMAFFHGYCGAEWRDDFALNLPSQDFVPNAQ